MIRRFACFAAGIALALAVVLPPLHAAPPTTSPTTDPAAWDDIDQRMIFFTVQLASVETSIDACNKALKAAGYKISLREDDATRYQKGNELMDRNAGGPVRWDEFYGKTAEKFFYNPAAPEGTLRLTVNVLKTHGEADAHEPLPASQRPPQFDYIYRANANQAAQAQADIAKLAGKTDQLLARRRQLEAEQSGLWCKIAFRPVAGKELLGKPLYRFDLKTTDAGPNAAQDLAAMQAAMDFLRLNNKLIENAETDVDTNQAGFVTSFTDDVAGSRTAFDAALMKQPAVVMDAYDAHTTIGKLEAVAKRMKDVAKNVADSYKLALDGDAANDDQRKNTFRAQLQESLMVYAEAVLAGDECVTQLAKEWKVVPNLEKAAADINLPPVPAAAPQSAQATPANDSKPAAASDAVPANGAAAVPLAKDNNFSITAAGNWQKTLTLTQGQNLLITATGTWSATPTGPRSSLGPDGRGDWYYLEGRIGENGTPFKVGSWLTTTAAADGMLYLRMKEGNFGDNSGALAVSIKLDSDAPKGSGPAAAPGSSPKADTGNAGSPAQAGASEILIGDRKIDLVDSTNTAEAADVLASTAKNYPEMLQSTAKAELVACHDADEFRRNGGKLVKMDGSYSDKVAAGRWGEIMLWGIYEKWTPGTYLFVYRVKAVSEVRGDKVCFCDVCIVGNTVCSRQPSANEFASGGWCNIPMAITLKNEREMEYRLWPFKAEMALDRVYVFRLQDASGQPTVLTVPAMYPPKEPTIPAGATILSARTGAGDTWNDVTARINELVDRGDSFRANGYLISFPDTHGTPKELQITMNVDGKKRVVSIPEDGPIVLPANASAAAGK